MNEIFRYRAVVFAILTASIVCARSGMAQTRLGLHVTAEEQAIWKMRRTDNSNGIGGVTFQSMYSTILNDANSFIAQSHPGGDGRWTGYTPSSPCDDADSNYVAGRSNGRSLMASAFHFLLTGDVRYANPVRTELLAQIADPNTDFANPAKWCPNTNNDATSHEITPWILRLVFAYDYLIAGGYTGFTASERADIETWFVNAATWWEGKASAIITQQRFPSRPDYTCAGWACPSSAIGATHWQGFTTYWFQEGWNNRISSSIMLAAAVGALTQNPTLMAKAKLWVKEAIMFATFPDGTYHDQYRWNGESGDGAIASSWTHVFYAIGPIISAADHIARRGDLDLYQFLTTTGMFGTAGGPKSIGLIAERAANMANNTVQAYATDNGTMNETTRIRPSIEGGHSEDFATAISNVFYQNDQVKTAYSRPPAQNSGCAGYDCNGSPWGVYPHVLFMFGDMEGKVSPFSAGGAQRATINFGATPTTISPGQSATLSWSTTNTSSCSASAGWTGTKATSGSESVTPSQTTSYTLSCSGSGGNASQTATITVSGSSGGTTLANSNTLLAHSNNFSSIYPRGPQNLWDGDTISEDGSTGNSDIASFWLEFDFGRLQDLTKARLFGDAEGDWVCQSWTLEYKQKQTDAYAAAFTNSPCFGNQWFEQALTGIRAQFVKVTVFGDPAIPATQARELELYGNPASTPPAPSGLTVRVQ